MELLGRYRVVYRTDGEIDKGMYKITPVMSGRTPWFVIFDRYQKIHKHTYTQNNKNTSV